MKKSNMKGYTALVGIVAGFYLLDKLHEMVGSAGIVIVGTVVVGLFIYSSSVGKEKSGQKNKSDPRLPGDSKENFGSSVRYKTSVKVDSDIYLYCTIDIEKNSKNYIVEVNSAITDNEGIDYGDDELYCKYNVKSRKWVDCLRPFNFRTPSAFVTFMVDAWQEVNGKIPVQLKSRALPKEVKASSSTVTLAVFDSELLQRQEKNIQVKGSGGNIYTVNLPDLTCTCLDFKKRRIGFPAGDVRRVCKHLAKEIIKRRLNTKISGDKKLQAFVRKASASRQGVPPFEKIISVKINEPVKGRKDFYLLTGTNDKGWVEVIWFTDRTYDGNGYNISEKRWAYGNNPFPDGSKTIYNLAIQQILKDEKPS